MKIMFSDRGLLTVVAIVVFVLFSLMSKDVFMILISIAMFLAMLIDLIASIFFYHRNRCRCSNSLASFKTWIWNEKIIELEFICKNFNSVISMPKWLKLQEIINLNNDKWRGLFRARFRFYGHYKIESLSISRKSLAGFLIYIENIPVEIEFIVYPETLYWVLKALALLGFYGSGIEESISSLYSISTFYGEFKGSREYMPGDAMKRIDWRTTAKLERIFIKEFYFGETFSEGLVADSRCIGRYTCDRIASAILSLAITQYLTGNIKIICNYSEGYCVEFKNNRELLLHVMNIIFKMNIVEYDQLYEFVEPVTVDILRKTLKDIEGEMGHSQKNILGIANKINQLYIVSMLLHNQDAILDVLRSIIEKSISVLIFTVSKPWLDARSVIEAYAISKNHENILNALKSMNINIVYTDLGVRTNE